MKPICVVVWGLLLGLCLVAIGADAPIVAPAKLPDLKAPELKADQLTSVVRVVDGDTIVVKTDTGLTKIRLVGVDTPETVDPRKPVEEYGREASRFTTNLLKGEQVYLVKDPQQGEKDRYGRTLAYVYRYPDGLFVNAEIVRQGYGHCYPDYPFKYLEQFRQLEQFARQAEKGLWGPKDKPAEPAPAVKAPVVPVVPPTVTRPPQVHPDQGDVTVYVTRTGAKYHRAGCRYLSKSMIPMKLKDAKQRYGPCSVCGPPQ